jgi:hypothetical protein
MGSARDCGRMIDDKIRDIALIVERSSVIYSAPRRRTVASLYRRLITHALSLPIYILATGFVDERHGH